MPDPPFPEPAAPQLPTRGGPVWAGPPTAPASPPPPPDRLREMSEAEQPPGPSIEPRRERLRPTWRQRIIKYMYLTCRDRWRATQDLVLFKSEFLEDEDKLLHICFAEYEKLCLRRNCEISLENPDQPKKLDISADFLLYLRKKLDENLISGSLFNLLGKWIFTTWIWKFWVRQRESYSGLANFCGVFFSETWIGSWWAAERTGISLSFNFFGNPDYWGWDEAQNRVLEGNELFKME